MVRASAVGSTERFDWWQPVQTECVRFTRVTDFPGSFEFVRCGVLSDFFSEYIYIYILRKSIERYVAART